MPSFPITTQDVRNAAQNIKGIAVVTPLLENQTVNELLGGRLLVKAENLQLTGAFKIRGAYNRLFYMSEKEQKNGVIAYSSGNHALGLAFAAKAYGCNATIVMPSDAPKDKVNAVNAVGAEVIFYDRNTEKSSDLIEKIISQTGKVEVPPSAHPLVLAGSGTAAMEVFDEFQDNIDKILVPCGGGGLTASTAIVASHISSKTGVYAVEPQGFDDTFRSLALGTPTPNEIGNKTICDSIMTPIPNDFTFSINRQLLSGGLVVRDASVQRAMAFCFHHFKLVCEPGGVVGVAAILENPSLIKNQTVATYITGGNIDQKRFSDLISAC
jgi:threonine dehydratase